ncbi:MAG: hypothetical protein ICV72_12265 [Aldersonia sp.]|nr:hypothetical protein [Aldersonia sp.]
MRIGGSNLKRTSCATVRPSSGSPTARSGVRAYQAGETTWREDSPEEVDIHVLENTGDTLLRFITVELLSARVGAQP